MQQIMKTISFPFTFFNISASIAIFTLLTACSQDQKLDAPQNIIASQGTYLGVVHLSWNPVSDAQHYNIEREKANTGEWLNAGSVVNAIFDDYGFNLPDNVLVYGERYRYRVSAGSSDADDSAFVMAGNEGWAYEPKKVSVTKTAESNGNVTVSWQEPNDLSALQNFTFVTYTISRSNDGSIFDDIGSVNDAQTFTDSSPGLNPEYKVKATYHYTYENMNYGTYDGSVQILSDSSSASSGGPGTSNFTRSDLGTISSQSGIPFTEAKVYNGSIYLTAITNADATGYGVPAIYKLNGSSWDSLGVPYPTGLINSTSLGVIDFATTGSDVFLAGLSSDSIFVYRYDGSNWSDNLTLNNLGQSTAPSSLSLEAVNSSLYLAITPAPDYDLKVQKLNGTSWDSVGGDANGWLETGNDIFDVGLENINGTLYIIYTTKNSEYNSTVHIKHFNGTAWANDLEWTADNIMKVKLAGGNNGQLYFIARSQKPAEYSGGVYKVSSSTTVENLIGSSDTWFLEPADISVDTNNQVFIASMKYVSASFIYPTINFYSNGEWKAVSGDFSDGILPVDLTSNGTDIYYVYGNNVNQTTWFAPTSLKSAKFIQ